MIHAVDCDRTICSLGYIFAAKCPRSLITAKRNSAMTIALKFPRVARQLIIAVRDGVLRFCCWPAAQLREGSIAVFSAVSPSPFSPWKGEKVADRPDDGVFAGSDAHRSFSALSATRSALACVQCNKTRIDSMTPANSSRRSGWTTVSRNHSANDGTRHSRSTLTGTVTLFCVIGLAFLAGCGDAASRSSAERSAGSESQRVVATVGMVADVVREIGGAQVEVTQLMGSGVDPHLYKATRDDVRQIIGADIVFTGGLMLEGRLQDTLDEVGKSRPVFAVTSKLPEQELLRPAGSGGHPDPHVWMDVAAWASCAEVISEALSTADPAHSSDFRKRAEEYRIKLKSLHEYGLTSIASIPKDRRVLVTSHDAFGYFGRAYGLEVVGVQGLSTESEAGLQRINELVDLLVERKLSAVFVESSVPPKNIQALIDGAKSRGHEVIIGGELFSDAMGADGTYEGTYIGMLDHNITIVTRSLGGTAPVRGLSGKLSAAKEQP